HAPWPATQAGPPPHAPWPATQAGPPWPATQGGPPAFLPAAPGSWSPLPAPAALPPGAAPQPTSPASPHPQAGRGGAGPAGSAPPVPAPERRRTRRRDRRPAAPQPPAAPPPGWRPPTGYVPVPVRRRRRWPWLLLLVVACCCACPGYFGRPMWQQYPASASVPDEVADLTLRDDATSQRATQQLEQDMRIAHTFAEQTFAAVYAAPGGKRVTVFGATGFRLSPDQDVTAEVNRLTETYALTEVAAVPTDQRGEYRRCGVGEAGDTPVVLCTWADHGSLGTGLFTGRSIPDSAALLDRLRSAIVTRG
ncbi:hypothetical protein ACFFWC_31525, partial [Plantactinospora siamensis]